MKLILSLTLITLLTSCAAPQAPVPQENYFRLVAHGSGASGDQRLTPGLLMVEELHSDGIHAERALIYSDDADHRRLNLYNYEFWSDPPARLIQSYLVQRLRHAGAATQVMRYDINSDAAAYVGGRLERFVQLIDAEQARVEVAVELRLSIAGERQPRLLRTYSAEVNVSGTGAEQTITGYEQALNQIINEFVADARRLPGTVH